METRINNLFLTVGTAILAINNEDDKESNKEIGDGNLAILLVKRKEAPYMGCWSLPEEPVNIDYTLEQTAENIVKDTTGLTEVYLKQLQTYEKDQLNKSSQNITCIYYALIDKTKVSIPDKHKDGDIVWFEISFDKKNKIMYLLSKSENIVICVTEQIKKNGIKEEVIYTTSEQVSVAFNHATIIIDILSVLRNQAEEEDLIFHLMPEAFIISDFQKVYETVLGEKILSSTLRRKIAEKIIKTEEFDSNKSHRPSRFYMYRKLNNKKIIKGGNDGGYS